MANPPKTAYGTDPIAPGDPCIDAAGSINVCARTVNDCSYRVALFTTQPGSGVQPVCYPQLAQSGNGSICALLPSGSGSSNDRWVTWSCEDDGSVYPTSGAFHFVASSCPDDDDFSACKHCQKPVPARLHLELESAIEAGSSTAHAAVNQPVSLMHSQDRNFPCCWFSPPIGASEAGANPAYWMLQKKAQDTWFLCLRRVSHEVAAYHLKSKNSHRFPLTLKRGRVSKDFKNWPATITIHAAK